MEWVLHYQDREPFTSDDGSWSDAPAFGVLALIVPDRAGQVGVVFDTGDFYIWPDWTPDPESADHWGVTDYLISSGLMSADDKLLDYSTAWLASHGVKFGRSLNNAEWRAFYQELIASYEKGGKYANERPA